MGYPSRPLLGSFQSKVLGRRLLAAEEERDVKVEGLVSVLASKSVSAASDSGEDSSPSWVDPDQRFFMESERGRLRVAGCGCLASGR